MPTESTEGPTPPGGPNELAQLLAAHLDTLRCFVRIHISPELRQREHDSDLVQSVCAEVLAKPDRFQWQGEAAFRSWLYRAVLDKVRHQLRFHRQERRNPAREVDAAARDSSLACTWADLVTPSRVAGSRELLQRFEQALAELPDQQREVLVRTRLLCMSHEETATELGISAVASRQLLHRAVARLTMVIAKAEG